jgi:peptidoglycan/LPS O-acetylase OafA/YrhL
VIADAYVGRVRLRGLRRLAPIAAAGLLVLAVVTPALVTVSDRAALSDLLWGAVWGAALGVLLAWLLLSPPPRLAPLSERLLGRALTPLGDVSYSLYVVHFPWLALLSAWWLSSHPRLPLGAELAVPGAAATILLAVACWYLVERHCVSSRAAPP